jgi:hypothetical protein
MFGAEVSEVFLAAHRAAKNTPDTSAPPLSGGSRLAPNLTCTRAGYIT